MTDIKNSDNMSTGAWDCFTSRREER